MSIEIRDSQISALAYIAGKKYKNLHDGYNHHAISNNEITNSGFTPNHQQLENERERV